MPATRLEGEPVLTTTLRRGLFLSAALTGGLLLVAFLAACGSDSSERAETPTALPPTLAAESVLALERFHYVAALTFREDRPGADGKQVAIPENPLARVADPRETGCLHLVLEHLRQTLWVNQRAGFRGEHPIRVSVRRAKRKLLRRLPPAVGAQGVHRPIVEFDAASTPSSLRLAHSHGVVRGSDCPSHGQEPLGKVDIRPPKAEEFPSPQPGQHGERPGCVEARSLGRSEELPDLASRPNGHLRHLPGSRWICVVHRVSPQNPPPDSIPQRLVQDDVDIPNRVRRETTGPIDVLSARLEFRIMSGTVFIQFSNLVGKVYYTAPGYMMPRMLQYYGLRWEFWN